MAYDVILEAVVGSTVHGTAVQDGLEDLDLMAVVLEDVHSFGGFNTKDTWTHRTKPMGVRSEAGDVDWVGYGLRKYLQLALKGNPSVLLPLFAQPPHIRVCSGAGFALRGLAPHIVSAQVYQPFRGYMRQQHERLLGLRGQRNVTRPELVEAYGFDTKYAAHVVRLGMQGAELLSTGRLSLPMRDEERRLCVDIRTGRYSLEEVSALIVDAERRLEVAYHETRLPEYPNVAAVELWMLNTYMEHWTKGVV
jgi:uncharacterized protein